MKKKNVTVLSVLIMALILVLSSCDVDGSKDEIKDPPVTQEYQGEVILDFEGLTDVSSNWEFNNGWLNSATLAALGLSTDSVGAITTGGRYYALDTAGEKVWPDDVDLGTQKLSFVLRSEQDADVLGNQYYANDNSVVDLDFKNLDLSGLDKADGIEFTMFVDGDIKSTGFTLILRSHDAEDVETAAFMVKLSDPEETTFNHDSDWFYWGDGAALHFTVPFECFTKFTWAPDTTPETLSEAITDDFNFDNLVFNFRLAGETNSSAIVDTDYPGWIDNIKLY